MIGLLIAAGRGRRMGGTKQLLPWPPATGHTTLIAAAFDTIASVCDHMLVVLDHEVDAVRAALGERQLTVVSGRADDDMFQSVHAGLTAAKQHGTTATLLQLGDHPDLKRTTLDALLEAHASHPNQVIIPEYDGRGGHPIVIPSTLIDRILTYSGTGGLRALLHEQAQLCYRVGVSDPAVIRDVDRADDLP
jgi:molybdenum cofactor cytidylyltransferase